jgi:hypothetical protein
VDNFSRRIAHHIHAQKLSCVTVKGQLQQPHAVIGDLAFDNFPETRHTCFAEHFLRRQLFFFPIIDFQSR